MIFEKIDDKLGEGFITATSVTDIYYIASKQKDKITAKKFLIDLLQVVGVVGVDRDIVIDAIESNIKDLEDAIQSIAAEYNEIDTVITRNTIDFIGSNINAIEPAEFLKDL